MGGIVIDLRLLYCPTAARWQTRTVMIDSRRDSSQVASSWNTYWHGTGDVGAYSSGGVSHPAIQAFWDEYFQTVQQEFDALKFIDIASGNGAVVERAREIFADAQPEFWPDGGKNQLESPQP